VDSHIRNRFLGAGAITERPHTLQGITVPQEQINTARVNNRKEEARRIQEIREEQIQSERKKVLAARRGGKKTTSQNELRKKTL